MLNALARPAVYAAAQRGGWKPVLNVSCRRHLIRRFMKSQFPGLHTKSFLFSYTFHIFSHPAEGDGGRRTRRLAAHAEGSEAPEAQNSVSCGAVSQADHRTVTASVCSKYSDV